MDNTIERLATAQQILRAIDTLTNCIAKIDDVTMKNDIAYDIHRIIEANEFTSTQAHIIMKWNIEANKDLFMNAK